MKIIFFLDNNEFVEVDPVNLQLRQLAAAQSAIGIEVTIPVRNEDGTPKTDDKGDTQMQTVFRPFVNYAVNLSVPPPPPDPVAVTSAVPVAPAPEPESTAPLSAPPAPVLSKKKKKDK
jgi:hypothetical protein